MRALLPFAVCVSLLAQWPSAPTPQAPRVPLTAEGKPDLAAPAPHRADGKPDLGGVWVADTSKYLMNLAADGVDVPFLPWAEAQYKRNKATLGTEDPEAQCLPQGIPKMNALPYPYKILQADGEVVFLYEAFTLFRQVFTDGRPLPRDPNPTWMGYATGKWQGETLVVDSSGFNTRLWIDTDGHPHSDALHVTERFRRRDFGHMDVEVTIDDPKTYREPWTVTIRQHLLPDSELIEFACTENNRSAQHLVHP